MRQLMVTGNKLIVNDKKMFAKEPHIWQKFTVASNIKTWDTEYIKSDKYDFTAGRNVAYANSYQEFFNAINPSTGLINWPRIQMNPLKVAYYYAWSENQPFPPHSSSTSAVSTAYYAKITNKTVNTTNTTIFYDLYHIYNVKLVARGPVEFVENVYSTDINEYPTDGEQDGYWYKRITKEALINGDSLLNTR